MREFVAVREVHPHNSFFSPHFIGRSSESYDVTYFRARVRGANLREPSTSAPQKEFPRLFQSQSRENRVERFPKNKSQRRQHQHFLHSQRRDTALSLHLRSALRVLISPARSSLSGRRWREAPSRDAGSEMVESSQRERSGGQGACGRAETHRRESVRGPHDSRGPHSKGPHS